MTTEPNDQSQQQQQPASVLLEGGNPVPAANDAPPAHGHTPSGETPMPERSTPLCEERIRDEVKKVIDPELFVNIVDLGLLYVVDLQPGEEGKTDVHVEMTMTSPMCPAGPQLVDQTRTVIEAIDGVGKVDIKVVMDPPWTPDRMTEDARDQLGIF